MKSGTFFMTRRKKKLMRNRL